MIDIIKQAGVGAVGATNPVHIVYGTVKKTNPLEVMVDQRFTLTGDFLVLPETLTRYEVDLEHVHPTSQGDTENSLTARLVIREGLQRNDRVILLRMQGGQQYIILDKVVEG